MILQILSFWTICFLWTVFSLFVTEVYYIVHNEDYYNWVTSMVTDDERESFKWKQMVKGILLGFLLWPYILFLMHRSFSSGRTAMFYLYEKIEDKRKEKEEVERRILEEKLDHY